MTNNLIPTINISSIVNKDFNSNKSIETINKIKKACINIGFFQVTGHGINKKNIKNICNVGNKFFNSPENNKKKLAPKKWNYKNKNIYRGYFPNDVNGKEGLDIGDLKVTKNYANTKKNKYIEYLNLNKSIDKKSIKIYVDNHYSVVTQIISDNNFFAHSGLYNLEGDTYTESFKIHKNPDMVGKSATFKYELSNKQLIISNDYMEEIWEKIE